jgi:hypothetical protein
LANRDGYSLTETVVLRKISSTNTVEVDSGETFEPAVAAMPCVLPPRRMRPDAHEGLLCDVLRIRGIAENAAGEPKHGRQMAKFWTLNTVKTYAC